MAQYRDLNAPPQQTFAEIVSAMQDQAKSSKTGASGVKDLGGSGDVVWPRPDGTPVSVRDVDLDLADARQRLEDAETSLAENGSRLTAAEQGVQDVRNDLDSIDWENLDGAEVYTNGPPPINPTVGKALWVSPTGRVFRAIECEEHA